MTDKKRRKEEGNEDKRAEKGRRKTTMTDGRTTTTHSITVLVQCAKKVRFAPTTKHNGAQKSKKAKQKIGHNQ